MFLIVKMIGINFITTKSTKRQKTSSRIRT